MIDVKPIEPNEDVTLVCIRVNDPTKDRKVPSVQMVCQECRESIWVSKVSLASIQKQPSARLKTICTTCIPLDVGNAKITPETFGEALRYGSP